MIEYFFFLIPCLCIQHADCFPKEHRQFLFYILYFSFQKSTVDFLCRRLVICNNPVKPLPDLKDKNFQDFFIWNHQLIHSIFRLTKPCEISSCEQYTPHIFCAVINLIISQIQPDSLLDSLSCNQLLDFIPGGRISLVYKTLHKIISTAVDPIRLWFCFWITHKIIDVINHIPRTVNVRISKMIPIVPFFHFFKMVLLVVGCQNLLDVFSCKSKFFVILNIIGRINFEVVQPCKNAFFWHTKTACQYSKLQKTVCF